MATSGSDNPFTGYEPNAAGAATFDMGTAASRAARVDSVFSQSGRDDTAVLPPWPGAAVHFSLSPDDEEILGPGVRPSPADPFNTDFETTWGLPLQGPPVQLPQQEPQQQPQYAPDAAQQPPA